MTRSKGRRGKGDSLAAVRGDLAQRKVTRGGGGGRGSDPGPASGTKALRKLVRAALEEGDLSGALAAFHGRARGAPAGAASSGGLDAPTLVALLAACAAAGALGPDAAGAVLARLTHLGGAMTLKEFAAMLASLPQRAPPADALAFADAAEPRTVFPDAAGHAHFRHYSRLLLRESLAEAGAALERAQQRPPRALADQGLAMLGLRASRDTGGPGGGGGGGGKAALTLVLTSLQPGVDVGRQARDAFKHGDVLLLSPYSEGGAGGGAGAQQPGGWGGGGGGPQQPPALGRPPSYPQLLGPNMPRVDSDPALLSRGAAHGYGGGGGGGGYAGYAVGGGGGSAAPWTPFSPDAYEVEVTLLVPVLTVRAPSPRAAAALACAPSLRADRLCNVVTSGRQMDALRRFADCDEGGTGAHGRSGVDPVLRAVVCGDPSDGGAATPALCSDPADAMPSDRLGAALAQAASLPGFNASQRAALGAALTRRLTLLQGPPGTGKTLVCCALVRLWLAAGAGPVLCCADSNTAVDNLVDGLARAGVRVVRVGRPDAVRPDLLRYCLEHASGAVPLPQPGGGPAAAAGPAGGARPRDEQRRMQKDCLAAAEAVCATCSGAGADAFERLRFPAVLLDEAAQATEPASLVPLCSGARRLALAGDHAQLPPTVLDREAGAAGLGVSLFERLARCGVQPYLLDTQYRMHPGLSAFPSAAFYGARLRAGTAAAARAPPRGFPWPTLAGASGGGGGVLAPLAFVHVPTSAERAEGTSHVNAAEAECVAAVLRGLLQPGGGGGGGGAGGGDLAPAHIGVVTPYAAQVRLLRRVLAPLRGAPPGGAGPGCGPPPLEIGSVDGFQGREKEVIVFCAVRATAAAGGGGGRPGGGPSSVGFLSDPRRLNVMLTRARRGLVVVGHAPTLRAEGGAWGAWMAWADACGLVLSPGLPPPAPRDPGAAAALAAADADVDGRPAAAGEVARGVRPYAAPGGGGGGGGGGAQPAGAAAAAAAGAAALPLQRAQQQQQQQPQQQRPQQQQQQQAPQPAAERGGGGPRGGGDDGGGERRRRRDDSRSRSRERKRRRRSRSRSRDRGRGGEREGERRRRHGSRSRSRGREPAHQPAQQPSQPQPPAQQPQQPAAAAAAPPPRGGDGGDDGRRRRYHDSRSRSRSRERRRRREREREDDRDRQREGARERGGDDGGRRAAAAQPPRSRSRSRERRAARADGGGGGGGGGGGRRSRSPDRGRRGGSGRDGGERALAAGAAPQPAAAVANGHR